MKGLSTNLISATYATGKRQGKTVFIPRMDMCSNSDNDIPFRLIRRQFPILPAFVMTINKSQGQSLEKLAIFLRQPVFSHGQLYVAFSRCTSEDGVKIIIAAGPKQGNLLNDQRVFTQNIVYREALQ